MNRCLQKLKWSPTQKCYLFYANYEKTIDIFGDRIKGSTLLKDHFFEAAIGTLLRLPYDYVRDCQFNSPDTFQNLPEEFKKKMLKIFKDSFTKRMKKIEFLSIANTLPSPLCRVLFDKSDSWKFCLMHVSFCVENSIHKLINMTVFEYIGLIVELGDGHAGGKDFNKFPKKVKKLVAQQRSDQSHPFPKEVKYFDGWWNEHYSKKDMKDFAY